MLEILNIVKGSTEEGIEISKGLARFSSICVLCSQEMYLTYLLKPIVPQSNSPTSKLKDGYRIHVVFLCCVVLCSFLVFSESPEVRVNSTDSTLQLQPQLSVVYSRLN